VTVDRVHRASCTDCGVIESMRQSERPTVDGRHYEFTVRFRDGSTTIFNETNPRMWRLGSRVMVIGRANTANK
jgi:hypothetical protein